MNPEPLHPFNYKAASEFHVNHIGDLDGVSIYLDVNPRTSHPYAFASGSRCGWFRELTGIPLDTDFMVPESVTTWVVAYEQLAGRSYQ